MINKYIVVGVSGSLRKASLNTVYLRSLALTCPKHIDFHIYENLASIPSFNVDHDDEPPAAVIDWKTFLSRSDMVVLVSPEYAHGISGVLKNALDWLVSDFKLLDRPLAFPNVSIRASLAQQQLDEVLRTMGFNLIDSCSPCASIEVPLIKPDLIAEEVVEHAELGLRLAAFWDSVDRYLTENIIEK